MEAAIRRALHTERATVRGTSDKAKVIPAYIPHVLDQVWVQRAAGHVGGVRSAWSGEYGWDKASQGGKVPNNAAHFPSKPVPGVEVIRSAYGLLLGSAAVAVRVAGADKDVVLPKGSNSNIGIRWGVEIVGVRAGSLADLCGVWRPGDVVLSAKSASHEVAWGSSGSSSLDGWSFQAVVDGYQAKEARLCVEIARPAPLVALEAALRGQAGALSHRVLTKGFTDKEWRLWAKVLAPTAALMAATGAGGGTPTRPPPLVFRAGAAGVEALPIADLMNLSSARNRTFHPKVRAMYQGLVEGAAPATDTSKPTKHSEVESALTSRLQSIMVRGGV